MARGRGGADTDELLGKASAAGYDLGGQRAAIEGARAG
jgi:hypothetical protein